MKNPPIDSSAACRELFQATPNAILFVDEGGRIVLANPACDTLFGYAPESLQGQNVNTLVPEGFSESVRRRAEAATGQQPRPMRQGRELVARHADGCELPVNISFTPLIAEGRHLIACSAARDLRGRSPDSVDARLQSAALQFAASGIVITDPSGTILWVNPAASAITGYSPDELVGQNVRVLKSGEHGQEVLRGSVGDDLQRQDVVGEDRQPPQGRLRVPGGADHRPGSRRQRERHPLRRDQAGRDRATADPGGARARPRRAGGAGDRDRRPEPPAP